MTPQRRTLCILSGHTPTADEPVMWQRTAPSPELDAKPVSAVVRKVLKDSALVRFRFCRGLHQPEPSLPLVPGASRARGGPSRLPP